MSVGNPAGHDQHDNYCCRFPLILTQEKTIGSLRDHCRYRGRSPQYRQLTAFRVGRSVCCGPVSMLLSLFCYQGFFQFKLGRMGYCLGDQSGHQLIRAYLAILEGVCLAKKDFHCSGHGPTTTNRHDEEGLSAKLAANRGFDPGVDLGILDTQNLTARACDTEGGLYIPSFVSGSTSASGSVNQVISFEQTNGDSIGVCDIS